MFSIQTWFDLVPTLWGTSVRMYALNYVDMIRQTTLIFWPLPYVHVCLNNSLTVSHLVNIITAWWTEGDITALILLHDWTYWTIHGFFIPCSTALRKIYGKLKYPILGHQLVCINTAGPNRQNHSKCKFEKLVQNYEWIMNEQTFNQQCWPEPLACFTVIVLYAHRQSQILIH